MPEVHPQITFLPEGILEVRKSTGNEDQDAAAAFTARIEQMDTLAGYEITDDGLEAIARVDIGEVTHSKEKYNFHSPKVNQLLDNLGEFVGSVGQNDPDDHIFGIDYLSNRGAYGVVFPHFQRWLSKGLDEETAQACINAMALPFGAEGKKQVKKYYSYRTDGVNTFAGIIGFSFSVASRRDEFGISGYDESGETVTYKDGQVAWNWIDLSTIGDCACWGAAADQRASVNLYSGSSRLYPIEPHNVDIAIQSLSLVLGAASLAYRAAQYQGNEDIFAEAEWQESR